MAGALFARCRGKHLPTFTPSMDMGGYVVVINCEKVAPPPPHAAPPRRPRLDVGAWHGHVTGYQLHNVNCTVLPAWESVHAECSGQFVRLQWTAGRACRCCGAALQQAIDRAEAPCTWSEVWAEHGGAR